MLASDIKEISDGIILYKQKASESSYEFYIEITHLQSLEVTLDFTNSENVYLEGTAKLITTTTAHPFTKTKLALLKLLDDWRITSRITCKLIDPPKAIIIDAIKRDTKEINLKLSNLTSVFNKTSIDLTPLTELEKILKSNNLSFIDFEFPPQDFLDKVTFAWKRLSQVAPKALVLPKQIEPFDVILGEGKGEWMRMAFVILSERPGCIERLFITKQANPYGIYRVKLCKNNDWHIVTIDDYFPYLLNGSSLLSHAMDKTYWVSLLEKAYCKLFNSYKILNYTGLHEIIYDLTGCPYQLFSLTGMDLESLWEILHENFTKGYLCCFFNDNTPQQDPACVLSIHSIEEKSLILCRNLSEHSKSKNWSESSKLWTGKIKSQVQPVFTSSSFWSELTEISENYDRLLISKLQPWFEFRHKGKFYRGENDTRSNVYFEVAIEERANIVVNVQQEDEREAGVSERRSYMDIGVVILKVNEENGFMVTEKKDLIIERSAILDIYLDPGVYIILPLTSGCLLSSPLEISPEKTKFVVSGELNPLFSSTLSDIFSKFDSNSEKTLKFEKFKSLHEKLGKIANEAEFKQKFLKKYLSKDDGITLQGFKSYMLEQVKAMPEDVIWEWLGQLGYDRDFYSMLSKLFFLSIHSDLPVSVNVRKNSIDLEDQVYRFFIQTQGVEIENKNGVKVLYYLCQDAHCYLYGVCNLKEEGIEATLDCSESENMMFSHENAAVTKFVGAGEITYMISGIALPHAESFLRTAKCTW